MKLADFAEVVKIEKGWSHEQKYKVTNSEGKNFLLRIAPSEQYENKKAEFENMQKLSELGIPMCQPIEFGNCEEGVYSLQSWIDGVGAEEAIASLPDSEIYRYGYEAGEILKKIHSIEVSGETGEWEPFFNQKMNRKIENYKKCPLKYEKGDLFIAYIEENRHLLKNRPVTYQHGDYHIGNLMINKEGKIVVFK